MLIVSRALFGVGMGAVWTAAMPLAIEHWPTHRRGTISGVLQSGFPTGFVLAAIVYHFFYPMFASRPDLGWRIMLASGIAPALLVIWIATGVKESPVWLAHRQNGHARREYEPLGIVRLFERGLVATTLQASLLMASLLSLYYAIAFWYPTLLTQLHRSSLAYVVALNCGTMAGEILWGRSSETRLGRRGAVTVATFAGLLAVPLYLYSTSPVLLGLGALAMGLFGAGCFGVVPTYLTERFPTAARAAGAGFAYHVGAAVSSLIPVTVGTLHDRGMPLPDAMAWAIVVLGVATVASIWLGPETRGRALTA